MKSQHGELLGLFFNKVSIKPIWYYFKLKYIVCICQFVISNNKKYTIQSNLKVGKGQNNNATRLT